MDQREFKKRLADLAAGKISHDDLLKDIKQQEPKQRPEPSNAPPHGKARKPVVPESTGLFDEPPKSQIAPGDVRKLRSAFLDAKQSLAQFETMLDKLLGSE